MPLFFKNEKFSLHIFLNTRKLGHYESPVDMFYIIEIMQR